MFLLTTLTKALDLQNMKQAAAFMTAENKFLRHACQKGLKGGDFSPVLRWYRLIQSNMRSLQNLV